MYSRYMGWCTAPLTTVHPVQERNASSTITIGHIGECHYVSTTALQNLLLLDIYDAEIQIKYSQLNQGSLTQCYLVNKDFLVESILKENNNSCVIPTGYLFCCHDFHISFIVQHNTQNNRYFMLTCENEQFHLLGPFSLNTFVKRVSEIHGQDDCINDGRKHLSYL